MTQRTSSESTWTGPDGVVHVAGAMTLERIFTEGEAALVGELREVARSLTGRYASDLADALDTGIRTLAPLALSLESYPSLKDPHVLGGRARTYETLMDTLVRGGEHGLEWVLPSKAVLARAFGIAKVNFFTDRAVQDDPYPYFDWVRGQGPVWREPRYGVFMVTGHPEARGGYGDPATFPVNDPPSGTYSSCNAVSGPFVKFSAPVEGDDISDVIMKCRHELPFSDKA